MKVIADIFRYILKKISKLTDELFFTPMPTSIAIPQNRPVRLVPCFVGMHHIFNHNYNEQLGLKVY